MPPREVGTCTRCRDSKRRCDKAKPSCARCMRVGVPCYYDIQRKNDGSPASIDTTPIPSSNISLIPSTRSSTSRNGKHDTETERTIKRRDRACLSCTRCHRLKVKCDQKRPCCSRCVRSGHERTCIYTHKVQLDEPVPTASSFALAEEDPEIILTIWFLQKRGPSHWRALLSRVSNVDYWLDC